MIVCPITLNQIIPIGGFVSVATKMDHPHITAKNPQKTLHQSLLVLFAEVDLVDQNPGQFGMIDRLKNPGISF